jgi:hypothetical protein
MVARWNHRWKPKEDADLLRLAEEEGYSGEQLGEHFGVTKRSAEQRLYQIRRSMRANAGEQPCGRPRPWTEFDNERLMAAVGPDQRFSDKAFKPIAQALNRSPTACRTQYRLLKAAAVLAEARASRAPRQHQTRAEMAAAAKAARHGVAEPLTLTAEIFGDPRPGQSALDKKRAGIVEREYFEPHSAALRPKPTLPGGPLR